MSVSLKKPSKVDLSNPELSRKLPEYTPVHLIDEEETIKSLPAIEIKQNSRFVADLITDFQNFDLSRKAIKRRHFIRVTSDDDKG